MSDIVLALAALLLGLFCLAYNHLARRDSDAPERPDRPVRAQNRHMAYLLMTGALVLSSACAIGVTVIQFLRAADLAYLILSVAGVLCQGAFFVAFGVYALSPIFSPRASEELPVGERHLALLPLALAVAGAVIQGIWRVRVALFFEAVSAFGVLTLIEHGGEASDRDAGERFRRGAIVMLALTFLSVILLSITLVLNLTRAQSDKIGNIQLEVIRDELEETINEAETDLLRVAIGVEQLMSANPSREVIAAYFDDLVQSFSEKNSFMNVYIAGSDWHVVPGFDAPESFHAAERVWYLGAQDSPGHMFISEPYVDASTGTMCFTVSTMLSDGETVVGMDLNFSKPQELILRMTQDRQQTAMIVTEGGLIAGYTDMALIGERADERLPEYAEILRRVAASQTHGSFRVALGGHPCVIFSAETSNNWYLILSVDTSTLYAEGYRQIAMLTSVNLLMLLLALLFYRLSDQSRRRVTRILAESRRCIDGYAGQLRDLSTHLIRLGDVRLLKEGGDPAELAAQVGDSGQRLSMLTGELSAYSGMLLRRAQRREARLNRRAAASIEVPSRKVRNVIIIAVLLSLSIMLFFCGRIAVEWGNTRKNRKADAYQNQLNEWLTQQQGRLYMFSDVIAAQPELLDDYDHAVAWLNDVAAHYPEISACFLGNPYAEHPVIMNNGWEPDEGDRPETRPWYRQTERSDEGFSISAP